MVILGLFCRIYVDLLEYIIKNKKLWVFVKNWFGDRYNENLGIFCCLVVYKGYYLLNLDIKIKILYDIWCMYFNS